MAPLHESWQGLFGRSVNRSFVDLLRHEAPDLLVSRAGVSAAPHADPHGLPGVPTGTTILALRYADGVIVGSAIVRQIAAHQNGGMVSEVSNFVHALKTAMVPGTAP